MPPDLFAGLLRVAAAQFAVGSLLVQWAVFRFARDRSPIRALLRSLPFGILPALVAFGVWVRGAWAIAGWETLVALEILLALVLLEAGLAILAWRGRNSGPLRSTVARVGTLAAGWAYVTALAWKVPGGPGETLFSITAIALCLGFLGLRVTRPRT